MTETTSASLEASVVASSTSSASSPLDPQAATESKAKAMHRMIRIRAHVTHPGSTGALPPRRCAPVDLQPWKTKGCPAERVGQTLEMAHASARVANDWRMFGIAAFVSVVTMPLTAVWFLLVGGALLIAGLLPAVFRRSGEVGRGVTRWPRAACGAGDLSLPRCCPVARRTTRQVQPLRRGGRGHAAGYDDSGSPLAFDRLCQCNGGRGRRGVGVLDTTCWPNACRV